MSETKQKLGPYTIGIVLIAGGILLLLLNFLDFDLLDFAWPFYIIFPGVAMLVIALAVNESAGQGLFIAGTIVTSLGLLLGYQNITNHWESWAYAWALVAPGSVGMALFIFGSMHGQSKMVADGKQIMKIGGILFACGFVFFELIIGISGFGFSAITWPILIIVIGILLVLRALFFGKPKAE